MALARWTLQTISAMTEAADLLAPQIAPPTLPVAVEFRGASATDAESRDENGFFKGSQGVLPRVPVHSLNHLAHWEIELAPRARAEAAATA